MNKLSDAKVYVVSMAGNTERRAKIKTQLSLIGLSPEFIDAVVGAELPSSEYFNLAVARRKRVLSPNELGCSLSHQLIYTDIIKKNIQYAIILEDDVSLDVSNWSKFKNITLKEDELYFLGGQEGMRRGRLLSAIRNYQFGKYSPLFISFFYRTCCYVVSKSTAIKMSELAKQKMYLADDWPHINKICNFSKLVFVPVFSHPIDNSDSLIEQERLSLK
ncbi:glycosyltransferase family 25 protein [Pseudoalteromonas sp. SWN29]|uniref:glycosyltransferase family 25 protein n=1 Tax=Pseudoalteromonas sp. SWN29 TaxID=2792064 RepID=UPI0018CC7D94|nr:glycosyltransferase family 25 protein [Pseudoalteromonas sp. SWN29]MBH0027523.1 glycosyltransferase family 25 protein [Pseudoalteromonas sp. SWN29]